MSQNRMVINYVPGDECRIAITEDGLLEELYSERLNALSHVGNIYAGRVVNVESSIQAAFVDFGLEQNGFLHITDLHPQYFPGEDGDTKERVGKKTPRRDRPPIQEALKRGNEIMVQVIKEGIGTKGPTLTSYLSIPGRFIVMMPHMDRVGVSRKVEDDEQRREARKTLDQLDLPEGFGFILRTAGIGRSKTELKRDLAYLQRLWKDMERRRGAGNKPRLLYTESDLLVRTLRDALTSEIDEIVIDDENALRRAGRFLKIAAPRAHIKLVHYNRPTPIFHAFGIEKQIDQIHEREALLKSGGRLVFDETEALVAIDVNSGKMRSHSDAEMTAFKTNMEAADEICRQLKLRDLGGLVVLDLIDMRSKSHRREVETKFKTLFKKDRARTKLLPISQLGLLELTRQRMRGSLRSAHFSECRACTGAGLLQRPESVASDAVRELAVVLAHDSVRRAEMVISPRVAGELLSSKRKLLGRLERTTGKRIDVRVSETISPDQITVYAYDERGADIEVATLPSPKAPQDLPSWKDDTTPAENWAIDPSEEMLEEDDFEEIEFVEDEISMVDPSASPSESTKKRKRRRRRRRKGGDGAPSAEQKETAAESTDESPESSGTTPTGDTRDDSTATESSSKKRRRRRRRKRKGDGAQPGATPADGDKSESAPGRTDAPAQSVNGEAGAGTAVQTDGEGATKKRRRRRGRRGGAKRRRAASAENGAPAETTERSAPVEDRAPAPAPAAAPEVAAEAPVAEAPTKKKTTRKKAAPRKTKTTKASTKKTTKKTSKKTAAKKKTVRKKAPARKKSAAAASKKTVTKGDEA